MAVNGSFLFLFSNWYIAKREESMKPESAALPAISVSAGRFSSNQPFVNNPFAYFISIWHCARHQGYVGGGNRQISLFTWHQHSIGGKQKRNKINE